MLVMVLCVQALHAGKGKIRVASDKQGAYVYVNGKKKAMTGEGFSSILLEEGEYTVKVVKGIDEYFEYAQSKEVFVGEDTSVKLNFTLKQERTAKGKARQAKKDASKLSRWRRSGEVITDTKLGLMWQDNSAAKSTKKNWKSAKSYCKNLSFGGYSDWRLANNIELLTIVDYDRNTPAIIPSFENANSERYWSADKYKYENYTAAWTIDFRIGYSGFSDPKKELNLRCLRGESKNNIIDSQKNLQWQDNSDSATIEKTWGKAISYCDSLILNGFSDWRLPSIHELSTIVDIKRVNPAIKTTIKNVHNSKKKTPSDAYWTISETASSKGNAWLVFFDIGSIRVNGKSMKRYVRCVRDNGK